MTKQTIMRKRRNLDRLRREILQQHATAAPTVRKLPPEPSPDMSMGGLSKIALEDDHYTGIIVRRFIGILKNEDISPVIRANAAVELGVIGRYKGQYAQKIKDALNYIKGIENTPKCLANMITPSLKEIDMPDPISARDLGLNDMD